MSDKVTDCSDREQVVICFRSVDEQYEAHEDFVGLYQVELIESSSIIEVLKDTVRLNLAMSSRQAQCYVSII